MKKLLSILFVTFLSCSESDSGIEISEQKVFLRLKSILKPKIESSLKASRSIHFFSNEDCYKDLDHEKITVEEKNKNQINKRLFRQPIKKGSPTEKANIAWGIPSLPDLAALHFNSLTVAASDSDLDSREVKLRSLCDMRKIESSVSVLTFEEKETNIRNKESAKRVVPFIIIAEMAPELFERDIEFLISCLIDNKRNEMELFITYLINTFVDQKILDEAIKQANFEEKIQALDKENVFIPNYFQCFLRDYLEIHDYEFPTLSAANEQSSYEEDDDADADFFPALSAEEEDSAISNLSATKRALYHKLSSPSFWPKDNSNLQMEPLALQF